MTDEPPTQATLATDVFVSYASQDVAVANAIVEALEKRAVTCWIAPRDVRAGAQYADAIVRAITNAKAFVVVLSEHAIASSHVSREIERAAAKKRPIIAWRVDAAALTPAFEYFLSESQWVETHAAKKEAAYAKLIDAIHGPERTASTDSSAASPEAPIARSSATPPKSRRNQILLASGLGVVAVALAALYAHKFSLVRQSPVNLPATAVANVVSNKSIAVLPFVDMSEKHDQEYFSDGLTEELIDHLTHIPDLKVIARTSSFAFKGKNEDMRSIATKLGVANLLEGSVRKSGGELRITAQLIRALDGVHLWSEIYDRKLTDIFKVQDEISTTVAKALNIALNMTPTGGGQIATNRTTNVEAYNLMLQGSYYFWRANVDDDARAVEFLQQAVHLDPHYVTAWARLARVYVWQGSMGQLTASEAQARSLDAVQRALTIDPNCAEAYYARGNLVGELLGDWTAASSDFARALALDPQGEIGEFAQGNLLILKSSMSGEYGETIDHMLRRLERNPLDLATMDYLAWSQQTAGLFDESAATSRRQLQLNPAYGGGQAQYAVTLLLMGKKAEALEAANKESDEMSKLRALACIYWAMGRRTEADSALAALEREFANRNPYDIAAAHAYRGETDAAFAWLERAYQQKRGSIEAVKTDLFFRNLHGDPRFDALLRKVKLVE